MEALVGGCKWIQLRMKEATADELRDAVKILKPACAEKEAILVIDDHVELVAELDVDGAQAVRNVVQALSTGVLKIMSKMGVSTIMSYRGAQLFEAA